MAPRPSQQRAQSPQPTVEPKMVPSLSAELEELDRRIRDRAYDLWASGAAGGGPLDLWLRAERELVWRPAVELRHTDGQIEVRAALAGVEPDDVDVQVSPNDILIRASTHHEHTAQDGAVDLCEFEQGTLFRALHFPAPIDPASAKAEYRNGLLRLTATLAPRPASGSASL